MEFKHGPLPTDMSITARHLALYRAVVFADGGYPRSTGAARALGLNDEEIEAAEEELAHHGLTNWAGYGPEGLAEIVASGPDKAQIPAALRWEVWELDDFRCRNCGVRRNLSIDHIVPEAKGGRTELANLQTLCVRCNSAKGAN